MAELVVRLVASLAVVVGLMLLLARVAGRRFAGRAGAPVQVVHRQPLSRGASVAVLTVGSRVLLVGATDQQVSLLTELDPEDLEELVLTSPTHEATDPARVLPAGAAGPLSGSLLSTDTWRRALAAATGRTP